MRRRASSSPRAKRSRAACSKAVSPSSPSCCRKNIWKIIVRCSKRDRNNVTVYLAEKPLLETLVGYSLFQGVLSVGKIPPPASLDEILQKSPAPKLFVAIDELSNAENLGALVRNCVAFGVHGLIVGETSAAHSCAVL